MLLGSFYTGLSGLQANAVALNVVGNNLANINTSGFKRSQANFAQIMSNTIKGISGAGNPIQIGLGVNTSEIVAKFEQGSIQNTGIKTHLAIQGEGFFQVNTNGINSYTRSGNFQFDEQGFLVSSNGSRVQGFVGTNADGTLDNSGGIVDVRVDLGQASPPRSTELARFITNLSAEAVIGDEYSTSIEVFDSKGVPHQFTITFVKPDPAVDATATEDDWDFTFTFDGLDTSAGGLTIEAPNGTDYPPGAGGDTFGRIRFDAAGNLESIMNSDGTYTAINTGGVATPGLTQPMVTIPAATVGGGASDMVIEWDLIDPPIDATTEPNSAFITNFGSTFNTGTLFQDGFGSGVLQDIDFDQDGTMIGFFDNGLSLELARIAVATFNNKVGLKQSDGGFYQQTAASGSASIDGEGTGGKGSLISSSLESSNVDIAEEFTSLIIHQRGYQSNSKTITTADQLLQEAINLKR